MWQDFYEQVLGPAIQQAYEAGKGYRNIRGAIRRECLDHVLTVSEGDLRRMLASYFHYYRRWRTHLSLAMDYPEVQSVDLPDRGAVVELPEVGGLHHHLSGWLHNVQ